MTSLKATQCYLKKSSINGIGVFAAVDIPEGSVICPETGSDGMVLISEADLLSLPQSIQEGVKRFFIYDEASKAYPVSKQGLAELNVSFFMNTNAPELCNVSEVDQGETKEYCKMIAKRDIAAHEELFHLYEINEEYTCSVPGCTELASQGNMGECGLSTCSKSQKPCHVNPVQDDTVEVPSTHQAIVTCPTERQVDAAGRYPGIPADDLYMLFENTWNPNMHKGGGPASVTLQFQTELAVDGQDLLPQSCVINSNNGFSAARRNRQYIMNYGGHQKIVERCPVSKPLAQVISEGPYGKQSFGSNLQDWPLWWREKFCFLDSEGSLQSKPLATICTRGSPAPKVNESLSDAMWTLQLHDDDEEQDLSWQELVSNIEHEQLKLISRWGWIPNKIGLPIRPTYAEECAMMMGFASHHLAPAGTPTAQRNIIGNSFTVPVIEYLLEPLLDHHCPGGWDVLSLFDGCGGAAVACVNINLPIRRYFSVEIDPRAQRCVKAYFREQGILKKLHLYSDITEWCTSDEALLNWVNEYDIRRGGLVVVAGSPCDNIPGTNNQWKADHVGAAGLTGQAGLQGAKSKLFYEFTRIVHGLSRVLQQRQQQTPMVDNSSEQIAGQQCFSKDRAPSSHVASAPASSFDAQNDTFIERGDWCSNPACC